jgi:hypothetical protein
MITIGKQIIYHEDKAYEVLGTFRFTEGLPIQEMKDYFGASLALRGGKLLYFCELIKDAEYD